MARRLPRRDYGLTTVSGPGAEPLSTAEAKAHLRVDISDDDTEIDEWVVTAREWLEEAIGIQLINAQYDLTLDEFPPGDDAILLPRWPLVSIDQIDYVDSAGDTQTWAATNYSADTTRRPGSVYPVFSEIWPATRRIQNAVTVRFTAGHGAAASSIPRRARAAVKLLLGHFYEHRNEVTELNLREMPLGARTLIEQLAAGDEFFQYVK